MKKEKENDFIGQMTFDNNLTTIARNLNVSKTTVYKWKSKHFPSLADENLKFKLFIKLYETGEFNTDELMYLLKVKRYNLMRFINKYQSLKTNKND